MAIDERKLRELAERWRNKANWATHRAHGAVLAQEGLAYRSCYNELIALLDAPAEQPTWEPGTVVVNGYGNFRLDSQSKQYPKMLNGVYVAVHLESPIPLGSERFESEDGFVEVHRLPHEFHVGDWFEHDGDVYQCKKIFENGHLLGDDGYDYEPEKCDHVPPPKPEPHRETMGDMRREMRIRERLSDIKTAVGNLEREVEDRQY